METLAAMRSAGRSIDRAAIHAEKAATNAAALFVEITRQRNVQVRKLVRCITLALPNCANVGKTAPGQWVW